MGGNNEQSERKRERKRYVSRERGGWRINERHRYSGGQEAAFVFRFVNSCPPLGVQRALSSPAMHTRAEDWGEERTEEERERHSQ